MAKKLSVKSLSIPIFIDMFLRYLSLMINTYMVSIHNNDLVGSMGSGNLIMDLFIILFAFLSVGCSVVVSQAIGAKNKALADATMHQSLGLNIILGFICAGVIVCFADSLLRVTNVPAEQFNQALIYLQMLGICVVFDAIGGMLASVIRVYNMAYFVTLASLIMNFVVIGSNYYVLNFTDLELFGVGLSTLLGRIVIIAILLYVFYQKLGLRISLQKLLHFDLSVIKKILNIGAFSAGENLVWLIQYAIAFSFVNLLGKDNANVQTIYFQITLLIMLTGHAISIANEIIIGKLVGAKYLDIAYKHTWKVLYFSLIATCIVVLVVFFSKSFIMDHLNLSDEAKEIMLPLFLVSIFLETGRTFNLIMVNALRASNDAIFPFYSGCVFMLGVSLPVGYMLCFHFGLGIVGIWIGFMADEWLRGIANSLRWKSKKWQSKTIV